MEFKVSFASQPRKFLKKLSINDRRRIIKKIRELSLNPLQKRAKVVEGKKERTYRIRVGDYRILYNVFLDANEILISVIDRRSRVYR